MRSNPKDKRLQRPYEAGEYSPLAELTSFAKIGLLILLALCPAFLHAQEVRLEGKVKDIHEEKLPLANILVLPDSIVLPSDAEGRFSAKIPSGAKNIRITYTGYEPLLSFLVLDKDTTVTFTLSPKIGRLQEVAITAKRYSQQNLVRSARTGTTVLTKKDITAPPALGGEADLIKTLQLLPGTIRGVEGSSDIFVRGGAADQNLVLLDGSTIYNTSHLFGFLSVFNPDILDRVEAIHGGFPARYGGRLSSILDISSNSSIAEETYISGNVGLIASRLYVEQPLVKEKLSLWVAGRRTYIDQVFGLIGRELPYYFYDLNGKLIYQAGRRDRIEISYYGGEDIFELHQQEDEENYGFSSSYTSGNASQSLQWYHQGRAGWNSHFTFSRTSFEYKIKNSFAENELNALSDIQDLSARMIFEKDSLWKGMGITSGVELTRHALSPNVVQSSGLFSDILESGGTGGRIAHQAAAFIEQDWRLWDKLLVNAGFRGSSALLKNKEYFVPEPRLAFSYALGENQSVKLSYSRMAQYMHRISSSAVSSPTDIWYPVTDSVPPQKSHQLATAWQKFLPKYHLMISAEAYYKSMDDLVGYEEGANLFLNPDFASQLVLGQGRAYGLEFLLRKEAGRLTGWLSYTLSWSWRQYDEINRGEWFLSRYDRRHNGALVMQYRLGSRWALSGVWEFISGSRFTPIIGQYIAPTPALSGVNLVPVYAEINQVKLSDTHRLDLGVKFSSKAGRRFEWQIFAGVNNIYNRASPAGIFIEQDKDGSLKYVQPGLFGLLPFVNFGFSF